MGARFVGAPRGERPGNRFHMPSLGSAFSNEKINPTPSAKQVGPLRIRAPATLPNHARFLPDAESARIQLREIDALGLSWGTSATGEVDSAVFIKKERGIGSIPTGFHWIGPGSLRILCREQQLFAPLWEHAGGHQIKFVLMMSKGGSPDSPGGVDSAQVQLFSPFEDMADLPPMDQVATMEDWQTGEIFEGAAGQIEI